MPRAEFDKCTKIAHQPDAPRGSSECILSYFAASKEAVDAILKRANAASGAMPGEVEDQPWGYSGYFTDPAYRILRDAGALA
jgi:predicted lactoylglutathione lyase